jgi:glycosyltransferase involved in cell wall biosynthesis
MNIVNVILGIVVPCYNEENVLPSTTESLIKILIELIENGDISKDSFILFVDDGSTDETWRIIEKYHKIDIHMKGIKLAANVGHQKALLAGLMEAKNKTDCIISIDADLQDDTSIIVDMVNQYKMGNEIVYGVRHSRRYDGFLKKSTALLFYKLLIFMGVKIVYNHADYRLVGRRALDELSNYRERNLFLRGIFPSMGYQTSHVLYNRLPRLAGETKYSFKKMLSLAWDGITSFSTVPLKIISVMGLILFLFCTLMAILIFGAKIFGHTVPGWASTTLPLYFLGGIQLLAIGIVGEYLGKIYIEVKSRPNYIIDKVLE